MVERHDRKAPASLAPARRLVTLQCAHRWVSGLAFGFLEDPLCKVFALSKLLRKTPCSGLEPGKPPFQRFSWLRFFCIVKFTLFYSRRLPSKSKGCAAGDFLGRRRRNFLDLSVGEPGKPLFRPQKTPCAAFCSPQGKPLVQHFDPLFSLKKVKKGFFRPQMPALASGGRRLGLGSGRRRERRCVVVSRAR